jgi:hypothetical protein
MALHNRMQGIRIPGNQGAGYQRISMPGKTDTDLIIRYPLPDLLII